MKETFDRRPLLAMRLAGGLFLAGAAAAGGLALAHGPALNMPLFGAGAFSAPAWEPAEAPASRPEPRKALARRAHADDDEDGSRRARTKRAKAAASGAKGHVLYGNAVCVRLCDGSFFPAVDAGGGDAACQAQCPDAPVAFYSMPGDDIAAAVSWTGAPYASLPVANRHRATFDNTCTCRRAGGMTADAAWRRDRTLRKGDVVATAGGFVVYSGGDGARRFTALAKTSDLGRDRRAELSAMERVSILAEADAPAAPRRPGGVTVSDSRTP